MIDGGLELRLRNDPTGDPVHEAGRFGTRLSRTATLGARPRSRTGVARPLGALLAGALVLAFVVVIRPILTEPAASPSPTPSQTPAAPPSDPELRSAVGGWATRFGQVDPPPISVTIIGPTGHARIHSQGPITASPPETATGRIGEASRLWLLAAVLALDACSRDVLVASCARDEFNTGLRLTDPVSRWLFAWPTDDPTTIGHLVEGSSGLAPIAAGIGDLADRIQADPGGARDRDDLLAGAIAATRRFPPGSQRSPVDTEFVILEDVIMAATGSPIATILPTDDYPPFRTRFADAEPLDLMPGSRTDGTPVADIPRAVLDILRNGAGASSSSQDLAEMARRVWSAEGIQAGPFDIFAPMRDESGGHAAPLGGDGLCPCDGERRLVIRRISQAYGWTSVVAYSYEHETAIGVVIGREWPVADVDALLQELTPLAVP